MPKVTSIGLDAFKGCTALTDVIVSYRLTNYDLYTYNMIIGSVQEKKIKAQEEEIKELKLVLESFKNCSCGNAMLSSCSEESVQNIVEYTKQLHSC
jgi:hypothetical protein